MPVENPYNFLKKQSDMKKGAIIGIAIAIIAAGGLGIYAVSNTLEGISNFDNDNPLEFGDEATATVKPPATVEEGGTELDFQDEATATVEPPATVEEDSGEEEGTKISFEDRAVATVREP